MEENEVTEEWTWMMKKNYEGYEATAHECRLHSTNG